MRSVLAFISVWGFTFSLMAGEANYVKPEPAPPEFAVQLRGMQFVKSADDAGTINPHAVVSDVLLSSVSTRKTAPPKVAIDSSKPEDSQPDVVRLDFSGKGNFSEAPFLSLKINSSSDQVCQATFGPEVVQIKRGQEALPVLVQGQYLKSPEYRYLSMQVLAAVQSKVSFGQKTHAVRLVDCNADFNFNDAPVPMGSNGEYFSMSMGDYLSIDLTDDGFRKPLTVPCGQPVLVDGQWYKISYDSDKKRISAQSVQLPTATIQHDQPLWSCKLATKDRTLFLHGGKEPIEAPAGEYSLIEYTAGPAMNSLREDGIKDCLLFIRGRNVSTGKSQRIVLAEGKTCPLAVGVPLQAKCIAKANGKNITFNMQLADREGNSVASILGPGGKQEQPKISVIDDSGKTVYSNTLEFG